MLDLANITCKWQSESKSRLKVDSNGGIVEGLRQKTRTGI